MRTTTKMMMMARGGGAAARGAGGPPRRHFVVARQRATSWECAGTRPPYGPDVGTPTRASSKPQGGASKSGASCEGPPLAADRPWRGRAFSSLSYASSTDNNKNDRDHGGSSPTKPSSASASAAVPRALYRQLLRWCRSPTNAGVPLSSIIPPVVHLRAPEQLDADRWQAIARAVSTASAREGPRGHPPDAVSKDDDDDGGAESLDPALETALRLLLRRDPREEEEDPGSMARATPAGGSCVCWGIVDPHSWTAPVHDATDLAQFFRVVFRANCSSSSNKSNTSISNPSPEHQRQRVSAGFEALRSLGEIDALVEELRARRDRHENDRLNHKLLFRVGQVVQHNEERWRGVIVGWEVADEAEADPPPTPKKRATSLTFKEYGAPTAAAATATPRPAEDHPPPPAPSPRSPIRYYVVLDDGEAHLMGVPSPGQTFAHQDELTALEDPDLLRIRSRTVAEHFGAFDRARGTFVPNERLKFEFALDALEADRAETWHPTSRLSAAEVELCQEVIQDCAHYAAELNRIVDAQLSSNSTHESSHLLTNLKDRLDRLRDGDVVPMGVQFATRQGPALSTVAAHHLRAWHNLQSEIMDLAFSRQAALVHRHRARFRLGDAVRHKKFGYRGIVVGWDPKPTVDVSRWDGLEHIEEPARHPFYHVVPDRGDSVEAFGGERPVRYVCQENLEVCPADKRFLDVDLEPQDWSWNPAEGRHLPSDALRFKYAEVGGDDGDDDDKNRTTEQCMAQIQDAINRWQYEARIAASVDSRTPLAVPKLIRLMQIVDNTPDAIAVQEAIKEMRKAHPRLDLRRRLEDGLGELMLGNGDEAIAVYTSIAEQVPDSYPEVHNKIATCLFMMGRIDEALESTLKTLTLDQYHVQAQNGLGLIYFDKGEYGQAIEAFRKSIRIDPWSPVTAKLSVSIDLVNQTAQDQGEEVSR